MKLNPKQKRFCEEYIKDLNATQAYIRAGYSKRSAENLASRMMGNDGVGAYIAELQAKISDRNAITVDNIVKFIKEVSEEARDGGDATNALKGADLLMKHLGGYDKDNVLKVDGMNKITVEFVDADEANTSKDI